MPSEDDGAHPFEAHVVDITARWARDAIEYSTGFLASKPASGNARLLPEHYFQISLLMGLLQHGLLAEPEPLSGQGRTDIKVRWHDDPNRRACIELKIWGRNDYAEVVEQLLGRYVLPDDDFACVVMVDRQARPLGPEYLRDVLREIPPDLRCAGHPAFVTTHARPVGKPIRIYHFLIQLPPDRIERP